MKIEKIDETKVLVAVDFINRLNQNLVHKISYFGDSREELEADFSALQPPEGYGYVAIGANDEIKGFFGIEIDRGLGRSWLFGPLVEHQDWDVIADQLYQSVLSDLPEEISNQELYFHGQNVRLEAFALQHGFDFNSEGASLELDVTLQRTGEVPGVFEFSQEYRSQFINLHAALFPNTYYSAEQLIALARDENKHLLVTVINGKLVGYCFFQARPASRDVYIDFLGIEPSFRRQGIARSLVAGVVDWAVRKSYVERITLTVSMDNEAAISLYHSLGFITQTVSRAYRKRT